MARYSLVSILLVFLIVEIVLSHPPPKGYGRPRTKIRISVVGGPGPRRRPSPFRVISSSSSRHYPRHHTFGPSRGRVKPSLSDCAKQGEWKPIIPLIPHETHQHEEETFYRGPPVDSHNIGIDAGSGGEAPAWQMPGSSPDNGGNSIDTSPPPWWNDDFFKGLGGPESGPSQGGGDLTHNIGNEIENNAIPQYPIAPPEHASREYAVREQIDDIPPPTQRPRGGTQIPILNIIPPSTTPAPPSQPPPPPPSPSQSFYTPNFFRRRRQKPSSDES